MAKWGSLVGKTAAPMAAALAAAAVAVAIFLWAGAEPAEATFPGENGRVAFTDGERPPTGVYDNDVVSAAPNGSDGTVLADTREAEYFPAWSPDGTRVAFLRDSTPDRQGDNAEELWVMDADGTNQERLSDGYGPPHYRSVDSRPAWSPDGTRIAFATRVESPEGGLRLYHGEIRVVNADGSGGEAVLADAPEDGADRAPAWSPDGARVAFVRDHDLDGAGRTDVYVARADGRGETNLSAVGPGERAGGASASHGEPAWSPDGESLAFVASTQGAGLVWSMGADGTAKRRLTDEAAYYGVRPAFSPDGTKIAYRPAGSLAVMDADGTDKERIVEASYPHVVGTFAWSPDGTRIAFDQTVDESGEALGVFAVDADGGGNPTGFGRGWAPDWQPVCPCPEPPKPPDATDPTVTSLKPPPGSKIRDRTPTVGVVVRDETGELTKADVGLYVDGKRKGFSYDPRSGRLGRTTGKLSHGRHTVRVTATDEAGNTATRRWSFKVARRG